MTGDADLGRGDGCAGVMAVSRSETGAAALLAGFETYGMFVADNGGNWLISIAPDRRIHGLESLSRVKGSDFEVIVPSPPPEH